MKIQLCIPTLNAGSQLKPLILCLQQQRGPSFGILVIDSSSSDSTVSTFKDIGAHTLVIKPSEFNHGATRQLALSLCPDADILVFMTQDSILVSPKSIENILKPFDDEKVGAVCGRQLPHANASPIAAHARLFNYSAQSSVKSKDDIPRLGIRAAFISNSFAAYRRSALMAVGGFPADVIFGEDTCAVAKMLLADWKVAYSAEAACYHSHNYSILEEFRRYFDIGVLHSRETWFLAELGKPEGEGKKFVVSEMRYLLRHAPWLIPPAIFRTGLKLLGYKLGQREQSMPSWLKLQLSMNKGYWKNKAA